MFFQVSLAFDDSKWNVIGIPLAVVYKDKYTNIFVFVIQEQFFLPGGQAR